MELEYRNSIVLKKVWVEMWRKVSLGRLSLMVIIIRLSWFEVEKVMIFLMLFWVRVYVVVNRVDRVFRYRYRVKVVWLLLNRGWVWISRKILVIIIVFECSRVDMGVGFFMVVGS